MPSAEATAAAILSKQAPRLFTCLSRLMRVSRVSKCAHGCGPALKVGLVGSGGDLAPNSGGRKKNFRGPRFLNDVFFGKNVRFQGKISDDLFLVIDLDFRIFPFFSQIFRIFTMLNVVYDPFLTRKTFFYSVQFILSHASDNTTYQNIGGTNAWAVPHLKVWGTVPPVPLGLRPCS